MLLAVCATSQTFAGKGSGADQNGGFLFGIRPTNDGQFVLVADTRNYRVLKFSAQSLAYIGVLARIPYATGLVQAPGEQGIVYVSSDILTYILTVDPTQGTTSAFAIVGDNQNYGLAVANDQSVLCASVQYNKRVTHWAAGSQTPSSLPAPPGGWAPFDIAVDKRNGSLLVSDLDNGRVLSFTQDGSLTGTLISGFAPGTLYGLAVNSAGNIYILDCVENGRLLKYDSSGRLIAKYGGRLRFPIGVAVQADGVVWVVEENGGKADAMPSAHKITCMV